MNAFVLDGGNTVSKIIKIKDRRRGIVIVTSCPVPGFKRTEQSKLDVLFQYSSCFRRNRSILRKANQLKVCNQVISYVTLFQRYLRFKTCRMRFKSRIEIYICISGDLRKR